MPTCAQSHVLNALACLTCASYPLSASPTPSALTWRQPENQDQVLRLSNIIGHWKKAPNTEISRLAAELELVLMLVKDIK